MTTNSETKTVLASRVRKLTRINDELTKELLCVKENKDAALLDANALRVHRDKSIESLDIMRKRYMAADKARTSQAEVIQAKTFTIAKLNTELSQTRKAMNIMAGALERILEVTR